MATEALHANHRFIKSLLSSHFGDAGVDPRPEELDRVSNVFHRYGGTWRGVFLGSVEDVTKLKLVLKIAIKNGHLTKAPKWEA